MVIFEGKTIKATTAAEKRRKELKEEARRILQTGGVLYVRVTRFMVKKKEEDAQALREKG
jgi:hypothetical protein